MSAVLKFEPAKIYEVFVSSRNNQQQWTMKVKAFGHSHAYRQAKSLHNVTVLSTRQITDINTYH